MSDSDDDCDDDSHDTCHTEHGGCSRDDYYQTYEDEPTRNKKALDANPSYLFTIIERDLQRDFNVIVSQVSLKPNNLIDSKGEFFKKPDGSAFKNITLISAAAFYRRNKMIDDLFLYEKKADGILNIRGKDESGCCAIDYAAGVGYSAATQKPADPKLLFRLIKKTFDQAESNNDAKVVSECFGYIKTYRDRFTNPDDYYNLAWMLSNGSKALAKDETQAFYFHNLVVDNVTLDLYKHAESGYYMAHCHLVGIGAEKSFTKAYKRASEAYQRYETQKTENKALKHVLDPLARTADLKEDSNDAKTENAALHSARIKLLNHYLISDEKKSEEYAKMLTDKKQKSEWENYFSVKKSIVSKKPIEAIKLLKQLDIEKVKIAFISIVQNNNNDILKHLARIELFKLTKEEKYCSELPREWQAYCQGIAAVKPRDEKAAVTVYSQAEECYCSYDVPGAIKFYSELAENDEKEKELTLHRDRISHLRLIATENELREISKITAKFNLRLDQHTNEKYKPQETKLLKEHEEKTFRFSDKNESLFQFYSARAGQNEGIAASCMQDDVNTLVHYRIEAISFYVKAFKYATDAQKVMLVTAVEMYANTTHNRATEIDQKKNNSEVVSFAQHALRTMPKPKSFFQSAMAIFSSDKNKTATASAAANTAANATLTPTQQLMITIANTSAPK